MLPPRLVRRLVLAPMVIVLFLGLIVLSPLLFVLALLFGLAGLLRAGRMRNLRLVSFLAVGLTAEIITLVLLFGLVISTPYLHHTQSTVRRRMTIALIVIVTAANFAAEGLLVHYLLRSGGSGGRSLVFSPLRSGSRT